MEIKPSDRLRLRVDALASRLREISDEVSRSKSEAIGLQRRIEEIEVALLFEDSDDVRRELVSLREQLATHQEKAAKAEADEARLRELLASARREYAAQLREERRRRWMVLE
jgi:hypothetical protein